MNIQTRPDQDIAIQQAISAGLIQSEMDIIDLGLKYLPHTDYLTGDAHITPKQAVARILEMRSGNYLPEGVTIKDLINEGRA